MNDKDVELFEAFTLEEIAQRREVQGGVKIDVSCGGIDYEKYYN